MCSGACRALRGGRRTAAAPTRWCMSTRRPRGRLALQLCTRSAAGSGAYREAMRAASAAGGMWNHERSSVEERRAGTLAGSEGAKVTKKLGLAAAGTTAEIGRRGGRGGSAGLQGGAIQPMTGEMMGTGAPAETREIRHPAWRRRNARREKSGAGGTAHAAGGSLVPAAQRGAATETTGRATRTKTRISTSTITRTATARSRSGTSMRSGDSYL